MGKSYYTDEVTKSVLQTIIKNSADIEAGVSDDLFHCIEDGFEGDNAVVGFWLASEFLDHSNPIPLFYVGFGPDTESQFRGAESLMQNVLRKARACAQAGMDTIKMVDDPVHFMVVRGEYFPWGGAIIRKIGRIEFVVSVSGFTQKEDNDAARTCWYRIKTILQKDITDDLRRADLEQDDPEYCKYPTGLVMRNAELGNLGEFPGQIG